MDAARKRWLVTVPFLERLGGSLPYCVRAGYTARRLYVYDVVGSGSKEELESTLGQRTTRNNTQ
jgi:hypothetical protein